MATIMTMSKAISLPVSITKSSRGFTLVEVMIVVAIIGILAAIAYPTYQRYVIKTKRTDMMSEMHNIALEIESRKLARGSYNTISASVNTDFATDYPKQGQQLYTVTITPVPLTEKWTITATPKPNSQMATDKAITLNYQGSKCRDTLCGLGDEWNQ